MIFKYSWPAIIWALIVLVLTLMPGKAIPDVGFFNADKLVHFFIFGFQMILTSFALVKIARLKAKPENPVLFAGVFSVLFGIMIEFIQNYVPGRSFSIADMIANTIGVILGYFTVRLLMRRRLI